jgi:formylglycine-generating enzyme required for sulfatase activity
MAFQHIVPGGTTADGVCCPATFRMGGRGFYDYEEPPHLVRLTRPFYLGAYPVTQAEFLAWKPDHEFDFGGRPQNPAERVTWDEAMAYCDWLNRLCYEQIPSGYVAGLPSEAQWEYACRAGTETEYYTGDGETALLEAGWFAGNSGRSTQPVGQLKANSFGLYDMHGNVHEWCRDAWDKHVYKCRVDGACDPEEPGEPGAYRVVRGGSWDYWAWLCRSAYRDGWELGGWEGILGFRVCLLSGPCQPRKSGSQNAERESAGKVGLRSRDVANKRSE